MAEESPELPERMRRLVSGHRDAVAHHFGPMAGGTAMKPCRVSVCLGLGPNSGSHLGQKCSVKFSRQISSNFFPGQLHWSLVSIRRVNRLAVQGSSFPHTGGHGVSPPPLPDRLMEIIGHFEGCLETRGGEGTPTHTFPPCFLPPPLARLF